jgi:photosystem II stability/assembly factor-like uncharacterized protein
MIFVISSNSFGDNRWVSIGPEGGSVPALAINPQTPEILYAETYGGGVFKSTNGGTNWSAIDTGLTNPYVLTLAINPQAPDTLYAGTEGGGVYKIQQTEPIGSVPTTTGWGKMLLIMFLALMAVYFLNKVRNSHSPL